MTKTFTLSETQLAFTLMGSGLVGTGIYELVTLVTAKPLRDSAGNYHKLLIFVMLVLGALFIAGALYHWECCETSKHHHEHRKHASVD